MIISLDLSGFHLSGDISGVNFSVFQDLVNLNLSHNSFTGRFPVGIFKLKNLRTLDISRNGFSGQFPDGVSGLERLVLFNAFSSSFSGALPAELSRIDSLVVVNLAGSYFSGRIPVEFGKFRRLEFIHLAGNLLNGSIPGELGQVQTLRHMEIGYNDFEGGLPWQIGNLSELHYLDVAGAGLSGSIPREICNLTKLESLFLFRNQISGMIPSEFSNMVSLSSLDLSDNQISGPIPDSIVELKNLRLLSLMCNEMSGNVPHGIAELPMLETLLIWNNSFTGSLPDSMGSNSKLEVVDVSSNGFNGSIPSKICDGGVLSKLIIFSNSFSGELPSSLSDCSSLIRLRVEDNSLLGSIALNFSSLRDISYIDLSRNNFTGGIPGDISQASKLVYFNVSSNPELGGYIPLDLWSLPLLRNFSASSCDLSGNLPSFASCESVSVIELSANALASTIPESILRCPSLERLNLSRNSLTGPIPEELASLPALSVLDISCNNLSGTIPDKFGNSSRLQLLNVSYNDLVGSIPQEKSFRLLGRSAFDGNPKLCGAPLRSCPRTVRDELLWILLLCATIIIFISLAVYGLFYLQRRRKGKPRMVWFSGLPHFTADDLVRSLCLTEATPTLSAQLHKVVLPTGLPVMAKQIDWEPRNAKIMMEYIGQMGYARHRNLTRLLGYCYNGHSCFLIYEYVAGGSLAEKIVVKRDWTTKCRLMVGIANGLKFLHHECYPSIPHGDLRINNIMFDENIEPKVAEFGVQFLVQLNRRSCSSKVASQHTGDLIDNIKDELDADISNFGHLILEILTNGRLNNVGKNSHDKTMEALVAEIHRENEVGSSKEDLKLVLEVAFRCMKNQPADRPAMEEACKILSRLK